MDNCCRPLIIIIIIMYIYRALIDALSAHMLHINLNTIFYTHAEHSPTNTIYTKYMGKPHTAQSYQHNLHKVYGKTTHRPQSYQHNLHKVYGKTTHTHTRKKKHARTHTHTRTNTHTHTHCSTAVGGSTVRESRKRIMNNYCRPLRL